LPLCNQFWFFSSQGGPVAVFPPFQNEINIFSLLQKAVENEASGGIVEKLVDGLVDYTKTHFFVEEQLMKVYAYPDMDSYMQAHERFRRQANAMVESLA